MGWGGDKYFLNVGDGNKELGDDWNGDVYLSVPMQLSTLQSSVAI